MQYVGGKSRLAKQIAAILEEHRQPGQLYIEPFVGACSVLTLMKPPRLASDIHAGLIQLWGEALAGRWFPPTQVTEDAYRRAKAGEFDAATNAFISFACSYGGKPWGGYARNKRGDSYAAMSANSLSKKIELLDSTTFVATDYRALKPDGALIYCDPPYRGTVGYGVPFDSDTFWEVMRFWSQNNTVIVSEYRAPPDFHAIHEFDHYRSLGANETVKERLFQYAP